MLGHLFQTQGWFEPVRTLVKIKQKTVVHSPADKLLDCLLGILCGIEALCQINTELAVDPAVNTAFGRPKCADQSNIQATLSAATFENVAQLRAANAQIFQKFAQAYHHDYAKTELILDLDLTGLPCSSHYEGAMPGYFAACKKGTRGRQLCRVSASQYNEIVYEELFPGNTGSVQFKVFKQVLEGALRVLGAEKVAKNRLILRLDGGYGTREIVNYLLAEGYQLSVKLHSGTRAKKLVKDLKEEQWHPEVGSERAWALVAEDGFYAQAEAKELRQIAVRCPQKERSRARAKTNRGNKPTPDQEEGATKTATSARYAYSVLLVYRAGLCAGLPTQALLAEQLAFYDDRACIESASFRGISRAWRWRNRVIRLGRTRDSNFTFAISP